MSNTAPARSGWLLLALLIVSFLFLLCAARFSSPLTSLTGIDYDVFRMGGDAFIRGEMYSGFFDNKGPYLFAINALGLLISSGKWGIFSLEVVSLSLTLFMLWRIGELLGASRGLNVVAQLFVLFLFTATISFGDSVEEWSLPWVVLPMWLYIRRSSLTFFWSGFALGVVALLRLNDCAIILAVLIVGLIQLLIGRDYSRFFKGIGIALVGFVVSILPAFIGALFLYDINEMIDATFVYNCKYWLHFGHQPLRVILGNSFRLIVCLILPFVAWRFDRLRSTHLLPIVAAACILTFLFTFRGMSIIHYCTMTLPLAYLMVIMLNGVSRIVKCLLLAVVAVPLVMYEPAIYWRAIDRPLSRFTAVGETVEMENTQTHLLDDFKRIVPDTLRNNVYCLDMPIGAWGLIHYGGGIPLGKYVNQQSLFSQVDPTKTGEILDEFYALRPLYIVSGRPLENTLLKDSASDYRLMGTSRCIYDGTVYFYRSVCHFD